MHSTVRTRLQDRREHLAKTLDHIRAQQSEVDANTEWKDSLAQRRRSALLADLFGWYHGRIERIDEALRRARLQQSTRPRA